MFGRKKRLLEQSQLYRQAGQVLETEAGKSLARAAFHGGKSINWLRISHKLQSYFHKKNPFFRS
jgi:hypothetical protein